MKSAFVVLILLSANSLPAQEVMLRPLIYSVDAMIDDTIHVCFNCDEQNGWIQDELLFYELTDKGDTLVLFKTEMYNNCIKGMSKWYNEKGELLREVSEGNGGCTVHAGMHYFIMPGNIRMYLAALIGHSTWWNENNTDIKSKEEFFREGDLEKRVKYYDSGLPKSEYHFRDDNSWSGWSNKNENHGVEIFGPFVEYYENGKKELEGSFERGLEVGTWKYYNEDGTIYEEKKYHSQDSISFTEFYPSGKPQHTYTRFKWRVVGDDLSFYESGQLKSYAHLDAKGEHDTTRLSFHENGQLMERYPCCGSGYTGNGLRTRWHVNGQKEEEVLLVEGQERGAYMAWHPNGKIATRGRYDNNGWKNGVWYFYKEDGRLDHTTDFDRNVEADVWDMAIINTSWIPDEPESYNDTRVFSQELPKASFLETWMPATEENGLEILRKNDTIQVSVAIDDSGKTAYTIRTPMKEKHRLVLEQFLLEKSVFDSPYMLMERAVPSVLIMEVYYREDQLR